MMSPSMWVSEVLVCITFACGLCMQKQVKNTYRLAQPFHISCGGTKEEVMNRNKAAKCGWCIVALGQQYRTEMR